jgi:hypothetical protein
VVKSPIPRPQTGLAPGYPLPRRQKENLAEFLSPVAGTAQGLPQDLAERFLRSAFSISAFQLFPLVCIFINTVTQFVPVRAQRANLKSRRDGMIIAQGKRGTSAALGK